MFLRIYFIKWNILGVILCHLTLISSIHSFDYLEHSYFTDRSCYEAQKILAKTGLRTSNEKARYLALAIVCPQDWSKNYCGSQRKLAQGNLNDLTTSPEKSGHFSLTLGDYSALVDHIPEYGQIKNISNLKAEGIITETLEVLSKDYGSPGGIIEDIAEESCEYSNRPNWIQVNNDISTFINSWVKNKKPMKLNKYLLGENKRGPLEPGPIDPSILFTIDNPKFLDMQLYNHNHFGKRAYRTWAGFHSTAITISNSRCENVLEIDESIIEDLAESLPAFAAINWDVNKNKHYASHACKVVTKLFQKKLLNWSIHADQKLVEPIKEYIHQLKNAQPSDAISARIVPSVLSLLIEGGGLHYLQDSTSGGHIRTDRTARGLEETRLNHDIDSKHGTLATLSSHNARFTFIAYGDTYLLGYPLGHKNKGLVEDTCSNLATNIEDRINNSKCLLAYQRGLITAMNSASLIDWSLGGVLYSDSNYDTFKGKPFAQKCMSGSLSERYVCEFLPTQAITVPSFSESNLSLKLSPGSIPVPPPKVEYESFRVSNAYDVANSLTQMGARLEFLKALGNGGDWLYSYNFSLFATLGDTAERQFLHEFAFIFHFRFATRLLLNMGPMTYFGFEEPNNKFNIFYGMGTEVGLTFLPEGWTKLPLEMTLSYRVPWRFVDSQFGFRGQRVEAHWVSFAIGLAFL